MFLCKVVLQNNSALLVSCYCGVQGLDISPAMLDVAHERETGGELCLHDLGHGLPFRPGTFDGAISISAVQWLCNAVWPSTELAWLDWAASTTELIEHDLPCRIAETRIPGSVCGASLGRCMLAWPGALVQSCRSTQRVLLRCHRVAWHAGF